MCNFTISWYLEQAGYMIGIIIRICSGTAILTYVASASLGLVGVAPHHHHHVEAVAFVGLATFSVRLDGVQFGVFGLVALASVVGRPRLLCGLPLVRLGFEAVLHLDFG